VVACAVGVFRCLDRLEAGDIWCGKTVLFGASNDQSLVPRVGPEGSISTGGEVDRSRDGASMQDDCRVLLVIPVAETLRAIQSSLLVSVDLVYNPVHHVITIDGYHVALARSVHAALVPPKRMAGQLRNTTRSRRRAALLEPGGQ